MSISIVDYASLQTAIANFLNRTDLTTTLPDFIGLFESYFVREAIRRGATREMESRSSTMSVSSQYTTLPTGFRGMRNAHISSTDPEATLRAATQEAIFGEFSGWTGQPEVYAIVGTEFLVGPTPDTTYTVTADIYTFTGLSVSNTTNWLITLHPDIYLFGSLAEAEPFIKDGNVVGYWQTRRDQACDALFQADAASRWSGSPLIMRPDGGTP